MKPYVPDKLPLKNIAWAKHVSAIGQAHKALGMYNGMLQSMMNPPLLLSPLTTREAVLSSQMEGIQATLEDVLRYDADPSESLEEGKYQDIMEIVNYRNAAIHAVKRLDTHPISLSLIKELHAILLDSERGHSKSPGEFRIMQNYIVGRPGASIEEAIFIPPSPADLMPSLDNFEKYIHFEEKDALVQLAIIKAQFQLIHPFLDGNGRISRLLIPLFLYAKKSICSPMFYLSSYLEGNRGAYHRNLQAVAEKKDWDSWISFFLQAITKQAEDSISKTRDMLSLYDEMKVEIPKITNSTFAMNACYALFAAPVMTTASFIESSGISKHSAIRIINRLQEYGLLVQLRKAKGRRAAIYQFKELFEIIK
ncbi:MAG TPA: Fic family protein [Candidatus Cloacimonetes bacterium]|nr:Fic family protein [Candidatus Cloacimonadota bacterium]